MGFALSIANNYIKLSVYRNGRFKINNIEGSVEFDSDNNGNLLYPKNTTFASVYIDGIHYYYGDSDGYFTLKPQKFGDKIKSAWIVNDVEITQILTLVKNPSTNNQDTVHIQYIAENKSSVSHKVGIRIMLDTMLGDNDSAPFKVSGLGNVTTEKMLFDNMIPPYWYCYDNLVAPKIVAMGTLTGEDVTKPDRVVFGSWQKLKTNPWDYTEEAGKSFAKDTAIALYYDPINLKPSKKYSVSTKYGILGIKINIKDQLAVFIGGDNFVKKPPFLFTVDVLNKGGIDFQWGGVAILLPKGFSIPKGFDKEYTVRPKRNGTTLIIKKFMGLPIGKTRSIILKLTYNDIIANQGGEYTIITKVMANNGRKSYILKKQKKIKIRKRPDIKAPNIYIFNPKDKINDVPNNGELNIIGYVGDIRGIKWLKVNGEKIRLQKISNVSQLKKEKLSVGFQEESDISFENFIAQTTRMLNYVILRRMVKYKKPVYVFQYDVRGLKKNSTVKIEAMDMNGNLEKNVFLFR